MKKLKITLYIITITALLCWDLLYTISGAIELRFYNGATYAYRRLLPLYRFYGNIYQNNILCRFCFFNYVYNDSICAYEHL